jgi:CDP-diacylglycerol--glycerol-3-phosphate 3-phosphatidyltransferase
MSVPNSLTFLRIGLTPVFLLLLFSPAPAMKQLALVVFVVAALTDWYDGWVARKYGYTSRFGKFLDPLADKILTLSALLGFVYLGLVDAWIVWVIVIRDIVITGLRSYAEYKGEPVITSKTAQAKTFGEFIVIYYILILYVASSVPPLHQNFRGFLDTMMNHQVLFGMILVVMLSTVGTGIMYLFDNRKFIRALYAGRASARPTG